MLKRNGCNVSINTPGCPRGLLNHENVWLFVVLAPCSITTYHHPHTSRPPTTIRASMLPRFLLIIFAISINAIPAITFDFATPEILPRAQDPDSPLEPLAGHRADELVEPIDQSKVIRGLLGRRQSSCSSNYFTCGVG